ncbi:Asp-tRNA(Asn)/Glu-tRNA(Gln) amidotransferase GatCAB subunit C [bacterium (Candidatus Gribaldobacteria) CG_4_9_14_3_um_filter_36_15]|uniref:Aspartyl/glutamyl-tRNA(Asn/Gln) amidotransferase subunit C n=4 Tax=Candidatus Gribaldobacteria TaxID=2798536 RepID=A0A2M7VK33_9BACT|nr:MAG: asparaginyl/glutamyl-tRNA amidotransferase subunit C [Parcubacteria group bacterium CG2_30_36_21]PIR91497.1 MAG: Asp-tRNA(Asn)/Glu-tRNA(Gln) amidotransferase GatCAB subunit C [bacterium (Candidatus Gribaldobacteria) CG10_big_fil_rev_8_21_14_0_10_37_46]PIV14151.1 MAG: Asp-tRNA(Asn)/Glu-tRNA(Gln) amidotransferase GatCAB subunit C [bacterium (Candidatus Gribaldobacteria) CG03_land_8_20_14_0_80_36_40]PJA02205.1 MAG: Asp-tRNA(Asn)/Glu-tRNA(Gln) amidotransferase GatCAB subunit C [bacterium (Ca
MISKKEVNHIAKLARLGLGEKEIEKMEKELSLILDYFNLLKEVDVSGIEPAFYSDERFKESPARDVMREDSVEESKKAKKLLDSVPETKEGFVKVKAIL